jgi:lysozyme
MTLALIDVSSVQIITPSQWGAIAKRGTRGGYAKCYEGNKGKDPSFDAKVANMRAVGLAPGGYSFVYPLPTDSAHAGRDPFDQAQTHFEALDGLGMASGDLLPAIDVEWPPPTSWSQWNVTAATIRQWLLDYLGKFEALCGRTPLLYTYPDFAAHLGFTDDFARYPLWAAEYSVLAPIHPWAGFTVLQVAGGSPSAMSHRYQQSTVLPSGAPVDTDVVADEATFQRLLAA